MKISKIVSLGSTAILAASAFAYSVACSAADNAKAVYVAELQPLNSQLGGNFYVFGLTCRRGYGNAIFT